METHDGFTMVPLPGGFTGYRASNGMTPEPVQYLVHGMIPRGSVVMLAGYGSSLKSWIAFDLAYAAATGGKWLERAETKESLVAYFDFETNLRQCGTRLFKLASGRKTEIPRKLRVLERPEALDSAEMEARLLELCRKTKLVIIDSFRAAVPGMEENDSRSRIVIDMLGRVAAATRCTFVVVHHAKKSGARGGKQSDPREVLRGSSALFDAPDVIIGVHLQRGEECSTVSSLKSREGKRFDPFLARLVDTGGGVVFETSDVKSLPDQVDHETETRILTFLSGAPGSSKNAIEKNVGGSSARVRRVFDSLVETKRVIEHGRGWKVPKGKAPQKRAAPKGGREP